MAMCIVLSFSACSGDDGKDYIFKYDIEGNPRTLDPQTANESSAAELIANIFDGLLRLDNDGNVECAVAESYTVSDDGLVYNFRLHENVYWTDGDEFKEQCTAADFVFAFQRLFKPSTKSSVAGSFFCIKNAEKVFGGSLSDYTQIGVKAEGDFELEITLEYPNPMLPVLLTTAPAMPCNEKFYYKTGGRYGLGADTIASNGSFYIQSWSYDQWSRDNNNIILRRNSLNNADENICPYGLNFFIDEEDSCTNFIEGESHVYITSGDEAVKLLDLGFSYTQSDNTVWGIMFNVRSEGMFANEHLREAVAYSTDRESAVLNSTGYSKAWDLVPESITVGTLGYRDFAGEKSALVYNSALAQAEMTEALKTISRSDFEGAKLIVPDDDELKSYISYFVQQWQSEIGFFCNVKTLSSSAYESAVKSGDFDFALVKIAGGYNSPSSYLSCFAKNDGMNFSGYYNSSYDALVQNAERAATEEKSAEYYSDAEQIIIEKALFIPLCYQSGYAFFAKKCEGINYNPFTKTVSFKEARRFS